MCFICSFFALTLDLIQRTFTLVLSCWILYAVCCGLSVAIVAGIAYGYNYSMAEFLTLARNDLTVYKRGDVPADRPELVHNIRRDDGEDYSDVVSDAFISRNQKDAEEIPSRDYRGIEENHRLLPLFPGDHKTTTWPSTWSILNPFIPTTEWNTDSNILIRDFETIDEAVLENRPKPVMDYDFDRIYRPAPDEIERRTLPVLPDVKLTVQGIPKRKLIQMRKWTTLKSNVPDKSTVRDVYGVFHKAVQNYK